MKRVSDKDFHGYVADEWLKITYISVHHYKKLVGTPSGDTAILLYLFYNMCSQMQKTDQIKATTAFAAKGLHMNYKKIRAAKKKLLEIGLIEDVSIFDSKTNRVKGWYIHLRYVSKEQNRKVFEEHNKQKILMETHPGKNGESGDLQASFHPGKKATRWTPYINAYRNTKVLNKNALRKINNFKSKSHSFGYPPSSFYDSENKFYLNIFRISRNQITKYNLNDPENPDNKYFIHLAKLLKKINSEEYPKMKFKGFNEWFNQIRLLVQQDLKIKPGRVPRKIKERIKAVLNYHAETIGNDYSHILQSGKSFRNKFFKVEAAMEKENRLNNNNSTIESRQGIINNDFTFSKDD